MGGQDAEKKSDVTNVFDLCSVGLIGLIYIGIFIYSIIVIINIYKINKK